MADSHCQDCLCAKEHHKYTLDGWACINCEQYCEDFDRGDDDAP